MKIILYFKQHIIPEHSNIVLEGTVFDNPRISPVQQCRYYYGKILSILTVTPFMISIIEILFYTLICFNWRVANLHSLCSFGKLGYLM